MGMFLNCIFCSTAFVCGCLSLKEVLINSDNLFACISAVIYFAFAMFYWKGTHDE